MAKIWLKSALNLTYLLCILCFDRVFLVLVFLSSIVFMNYP